MFDIYEIYSAVRTRTTWLFPGVRELTYHHWMRGSWHLHDLARNLADWGIY